MKALIKAIAGVSLALATASAAFAEGALVINAENGNETPSDTLSSLLVGKNKFWPSGDPVIIVVQKDSPAAESLLQQYTNMDESRFKSHWQRLAFSGRGTMPKQFNDPAAVVAFVKVNKGAIGILDNATTDTSPVKKLD